MLCYVMRSLFALSWIQISQKYNAVAVVVSAV